jgi:hypothetical protein
MWERMMNIRELSAPLYNAKGWLKLLGVMKCIYGVATAITIIGLIVAWLPIWIGVLLFQTAGTIEKAHDAEDETAFLASMGKLKTYFTIMGVLTLVGLVFGVIGFFFGGMSAIQSM